MVSPIGISSRLVSLYKNFLFLFSLYVLIYPFKVTPARKCSVLKAIHVFLYSLLNYSVLTMDYRLSCGEISALEGGVE